MSRLVRCEAAQHKVFNFTYKLWLNLPAWYLPILTSCAHLITMYLLFTLHQIDCFLTVAFSGFCCLVFGSALTRPIELIDGMLASWISVLIIITSRFS
jgi:hypothetical protein